MFFLKSRFDLLDVKNVPPFYSTTNKLLLLLLSSSLHGATLVYFYSNARYNLPLLFCTGMLC